MSVMSVKTYYVIKHRVYGDEISGLYEVVAIVTDKDIAEHFCNKYGYVYNEEEINYAG